jgi:peptidoglycan hydrolase CwlO-like protein
MKLKQGLNQFYSGGIFVMKHSKQIAGLAVAAAMTASSVFPAFADTTKEEVQQQISDYQNQQDDLEQQLADLKQNQSDAAAYLSQLDGMIDNYLSELDTVEQQISETNDQISVTKADLQAAKDDEAEQYNALKARIQAMYESGDQNYLELFLGEADLNDTLNNYEYVSQINTYDSNLLQQLKDTRQQIEDYEADLENQQAIQEQQEEAYQVEMDSLQKIADQRQEELDSLGDQISSLNYDISTVQDKLDAQKTVLADLNSAEQAEEQASAAKAAAASSSSSSAAQTVSTSTASSGSTSSGSAADTSSSSSSSQTSSSGSSSSASSSSSDTSSSSGSSYSGTVLSKSRGSVMGPSGKETYYNLNMGGVVSIMRSLGYSAEEYPYWVRSDGCKMLGNYIMVAANLSIRPKGTIVQTSLGAGIVCDTGGFASSNAYQLDIATNW